ncbi:hypothetical protein MJO29_000866 [Puccinia striiformis f. sp. tritici]|uniref:Phosphatidylglycerol/phosphatidylinositol transfer protein n=4 Tax=Puccinia striiformis TaxID=27350 RepID=A0A0L0VY89_9BASI|nr:hypothetical protein MJO29_000866 [Puccinia striiformis f. sp. tritici]KNF04238.1 hypothetical protein PSTG_02587 [Puccinia striiformis f. sp. tritici PST-78]POW01547.1 hypothetical protein PSTT_12433 [Puccinia striiformis]POW08603.1 hypothetical protein PSHT_09479 [Puccinia striiformis]
MLLSALPFFTSLLVLIALPSRGQPTELVEANINGNASQHQFTQLGLAGTLLMPAEGAQFVNQGGAMGDIQLVYNCPTTFPSSNIGDRTLAIDVVLVPRREQGYNPGPSRVILARGLRARNGVSGERIQVNFVPPLTTCGDYRMIVTESQIFQNAVVQFSAGAPAVSVACSPMDDY